MKRITALSLLITVPLTLVATACSKSAESQDGETKTQAPEEKTPRQIGPIEGEYSVQCGCQIDGIDACGNYVHVGDHAFEIMGDLGLGVMEWCSVDGTKQANVKGKLEGDRFYAESLTVNP